MRFLLFFCVLLFHPQIINAQQVFVEKYPVDVYQGAIQNWAMVQDKKGVLYVANNDGVLQYDGVKWGLIKIPNQNFVFSLAIDSTGVLYLGSFNEMGFLKKDNTANWKYHSLMPFLHEKHKAVKDVIQTAIFDGSVFFTDRRAVYVFRNGKFKIFDISGKWFSPTKNQLFLTTDSGLMVYYRSGFKQAGFNKIITGLNVNHIIDYENGTFLFTDATNKVWLLDTAAATKNKLRPFVKNLARYTKGSNIRTINYLDNGLVAIRSREAIVFADKDGRVVYYNSKDMLGVDLGTGFSFQDRRHNLWIGTDSFISEMITSSPLSFFDKQNGLEETILSLGKKDGYLYAGTMKGLFYLDSRSGFSLIPGLLGNSWNLFNFGQKLYLSQGSGVFELQGDKAIRLINHQYVQTIGEVRGRPDRMIMGTYNTGIWLLEKTSGAWREKKIKGFEEETRFIQQDDDSGFWISHYNKGIFKLRLNVAMDSVTGETFYDSKNGLPSNLNNRIYRLNSGKIIATTVDGIYTFNKITKRFQPDPAFRQSVGGPLCIYTIKESLNGNVYFWGAPSKSMETAGVFIKQRNGKYKLQFIPLNKISVHTNGLRVDVDAPLLAAGQNEIWMGNGEKLIVYNAAQKTFYNQPFSIFIKEVHAGDSVIYTNDEKRRQNSVPFSLNKLKFSFASTFYESPEKTTYQYKLEGFENKWSGWVPASEAEFTNLNNGDYKFVVRAKNLYGQVSRPVYFSFHINAPWYKTWWSYTVYLMLLCSVVLLYNKLNTDRINRLRVELEENVALKTIELTKKNEEVLQKSREIEAQAKKLQELNLTKDKLFSIISHDLRGPIGQLKSTLEMIGSGDLSVAELGNIIPELNTSISSAFSLTDNLLYWARSQMEGIQVKQVWFDLKEIADENFHLFKPKADEKKITLINSVITSTVLYSDIDMIKLVLRNLINNAVKFTYSGGTVTIGSEVKAGFVDVFVKDNGTGLSADEIQSILSNENFHKNGTSGEKGSGLGLMLCQDFIEKNGGEMFVESELGKGSKFSFRLYLNNNKA